MLVGAALPLFTGLGLEAWTADWDRKLDVVIGNSTAWRVANGLVIFGAVVTVVGIALVANLLRDLNRPSEAAAAVALFPVGVALEAVSRTANMTTTVWAAEAKAAGDTSYRLFEVIDQWRDSWAICFSSWQPWPWSSSGLASSAPAGWHSGCSASSSAGLPFSSP
jgi:hypothetical protein